MKENSTIQKLCLLMFIFFIGTSAEISAQSLDNFYDDFWEVYWVRTTMERSGNESVRLMGTNPKSYSYSGINFSGRVDNHETLDWHFDFRNRVLGDLVSVLYYTVSDPDNSKQYTDRIKNNSISTGYFGDYNLGLNAFTTDWLVASAGMNISDHFINDQSSGHHAYHFALGVYAHTDVAITDWLAARVTVSAAKAVTKKRALNSERIYLPVFLTIMPEIFTSFGLFAGLDFYSAIHDGPVKQKRMDIKIGWRF